MSASNVSKEIEEREKERIRFDVELEFIQALGNPDYLHYLAVRGYFEDKEVIDYIKYLYNYWSSDGYSKFIVYPYCLTMVKLIIENKDNFIQDLKIPSCIENLHYQQFCFWKNRKARLVHFD